MQKNSNKSIKALSLFMIALLLVFTATLGNTFAWFTDNDTNSGNTIETGEIHTVVAQGAEGGVTWTLTDLGRLTISPSTSIVPDKNSGKEFVPGAWREAVVYNKNGDATAIGGYPYNVNAVKSLVIEEGVVSIGSFTAKFPNLTGEVVIPASVNYIGQEAFQNAKITKLTFAEGGTEPLIIGPGAFKNLQITELELPADRPSITIRCWAFNGCKNLESVTLPANIITFSRWTNAEYYGMDWVYGSYSWSSDIFDKCNALKSITFGSQEVHDMFFAADGNKHTIENEIQNVTITIL